MSPVFTYIGPGAGIAFAGSFLSLIVSFFLTAAALLAWPFRFAWALLRGRRGYRNAKIQRLIFLGLDGLDPQLAERFMAEGKLPNFSRLKEQGSFHRLRTTCPPLSPVAWSTFATGANPGKHNIFDFLNRSLKSYVPQLAPSKVRPAGRIWRIGRWRIPLAPPVVENRRKSQTFWKILGDHSISSTILRVPITFPPEKFNGLMLSAMCAPDLLGTQGSFSQFTTRLEKPAFESGSRYPLHRSQDHFTGSLEGPVNSFTAEGCALRIPFRLLNSPGSVTLEIQGESYHLKAGEYSAWIPLAFRAAPGIAIRGLARFLITETTPELSMYVTPIQIDPEAPALPISHPAYYSAYLAKLLGPFATAGMAEDTWALNEGVIDDAGFLDQTYLIMAERESMFDSALAHTRRGVVACVFDTSDRVQHMFFNARKPAVIEDLYQRMDRLVGNAMRHVDDKTILFVLSDHGFCAFRRAVNLNSWLHENGYLTLLPGKTESGRSFEGVDWSRTRAYFLGLSGLYLNVKGREPSGTVAPGKEAEGLRRELMAKLAELRDDHSAGVPISRVYETVNLYRGPYLDAAPDLIIGFNQGYRASWDGSIGKITGSVIEDNPKPWCGDHCVDPALVPGVLFSSRPIVAENPGIEDLAPTALQLFGVPLPAWMDGKPLFTTA